MQKYGSIDGFSKEELEEALEKKQAEEEVKDRPVLIDLPDLTELKKSCEFQIQEVIDGKHVDSDSDHYIYEAAMETFYGKGIWGWINKHIN